MFYLHICTDYSTPKQISEINRKQMKSEQTKIFKILSKTLIDLKFQSTPRECFSLFLKNLNGHLEWTSTYILYEHFENKLLLN